MREGRNIEMTERWTIQVSSAFKTLGVPNLPIDMGLTRIGRLALAIVLDFPSGR